MAPCGDILTTLYSSQYNFIVTVIMPLNGYVESRLIDRKNPNADILTCAMFQCQPFEVRIDFAPTYGRRLDEGDEGDALTADGDQPGRRLQGGVPPNLAGYRRDVALEIAGNSLYWSVLDHETESLFMGNMQGPFNGTICFKNPPPQMPPPPSPPPSPPPVAAAVAPTAVATAAGISAVMWHHVPGRPVVLQPQASVLYHDRKSVLWLRCTGCKPPDPPSPPPLPPPSPPPPPPIQPLRSAAIRVEVARAATSIR